MKRAQQTLLFLALCLSYTGSSQIPVSTLISTPLSQSADEVGFKIPVFGLLIWWDEILEMGCRRMPRITIAGGTNLYPYRCNDDPDWCYDLSCLSFAAFPVYLPARVQDRNWYSDKQIDRFGSYKLITEPGGWYALDFSDQTTRTTMLKYAKAPKRQYGVPGIFLDSLHAPISGLQDFQTEAHAQGFQLYASWGGFKGMIGLPMDHPLRRDPNFIGGDEGLSVQDYMKTISVSPKEIPYIIMADFTTLCHPQEQQERLQHEINLTCLVLYLEAIKGRKVWLSLTEDSTYRVNRLTQKIAGYDYGRILTLVENVPSYVEITVANGRNATFLDREHAIIIHNEDETAIRIQLPPEPIYSVFQPGGEKITAPADATISAGEYYLLLK